MPGILEERGDMFLGTYFATKFCQAKIQVGQDFKCNGQGNRLSEFFNSAPSEVPRF